MDGQLLLLCKYSDSTVALNVPRSHTYENLVTILCGRLNGLKPTEICMVYSIPGHQKCKLEHNDDLQALFLLVSQLGLTHVDVHVSLLSSQNVLAVCSIDAFSSDDETDTNHQEEIHTDWRLEFQQQTDLLPTFSKHPEKVLLSAPWKNGLTHVGQKFMGGVRDFRTVLSKYAIESGFEYVYIKNDKVRVTAICKYKLTNGCMWNVHARVCNGNSFFRICRLNNVHTCGAAVRTDSHSRMSSKLISNLIVENVRATPLKRPIDVKSDFKVNYGQEISYYKAWLGVEKARAQVFGDYSTSFEKLRWYVDELKKTNPGTYVQFEYDSTTRKFSRLFIAFWATIQGFNDCRPLLFLDATFLKGRTKGTLLAATAKDGNQGLFPLSFAVVSSENHDNWEWFLVHLKNILVPGRTITFVSDRNWGLLEAMPKVFPDSPHGFCLLHLKRNLKNHFRGAPNGIRERLASLLDLCAFSPTVEIFNMVMDELKDLGKRRVENFIQSLPPEHWSNAFFNGQRYGEMWSNAAESFNNWILEERHLPITEMVDKIRVRLMNKFTSRRQKASKWKGTICPKMEKKLHIAFDEGKTWEVSTSSPTVYEVHSDPSMSVDIRKHTCSCCQWQVNGFPCSHAVAAIRKSGHDLNVFVTRYYHVRSFVSTYSYFISPMPTTWMPKMVEAKDMIKPPTSTKQPGRPKKKRIPSIGENVRQIKCSRCGTKGHHNRKSCKEPA